MARSHWCRLCSAIREQSQQPGKLGKRPWELSFECGNFEHDRPRDKCSKFFPIEVPVKPSPFTRVATTSNEQECASATAALDCAFRNFTLRHRSVLPMLMKPFLCL